MAQGHSFLKLSLFMIALLVITTVSDLSQVMASRDFALDMAVVEQNLLPQGRGLGTCLRKCRSASDCDDCWLCCDCVPLYWGSPDATCDKATVSGKGYFRTLLQARNNQPKIVPVA